MTCIRVLILSSPATNRLTLTPACSLVEVSRRQTYHRVSASAPTGRVSHPNLVKCCTVVAFIGTVTFAGSPVVVAILCVLGATVTIGLTLEELVPEGVIRGVVPVVEYYP